MADLIAIKKTNWSAIIAVILFFVLIAGGFAFKVLTDKKEAEKQKAITDKYIVEQNLFAEQFKTRKYIDQLNQLHHVFAIQVMSLNNLQYKNARLYEQYKESENKVLLLSQNVLTLQGTISDLQGNVITLDSNTFSNIWEKSIFSENNQHEKDFSLDLKGLFIYKYDTINKTLYWNKELSKIDYKTEFSIVSTLEIDSAKKLRITVRNSNKDLVIKNTSYIDEKFLRSYYNGLNTGGVKPLKEKQKYFSIGLGLQSGWTLEKSLITTAWENKFYVGLGVGVYFNLFSF